MLRAYAWKRFGYVGYWDADLATPLEESTACIAWRPAGPASRSCWGCGSIAWVRRCTSRRSGITPGRVFATFASLVLGLPVYDTQCGAKLVHAPIVPQLFGEPFSSRWIFDVEVLARLRNLIGAEVDADGGGGDAAANVARHQRVEDAPRRDAARRRSSCCRSRGGITRGLQAPGSRLQATGSRLQAGATPLAAQWRNVPVDGVPLGADGKPNLDAPAPRTTAGRVDLSGIYQSSYKYLPETSRRISISTRCR